MKKKKQPKLKICSKCHLYRPVGMFYWNRRTQPDGTVKNQRRPDCRKCFRGQQNKKYRKMKKGKSKK